MGVLSNIGSYFKSLLPSIKKRDMLIDVAHSFEELNQVIQPTYGLSPLPTFDSATEKTTNFAFKKQMDNFNDSAYRTIAATIDIILDNEDGITALVSKEFSDENLKTITDYYKLNLMKYIEALTFFNDYARMWMSVVVWESLEKAVMLTGDARDAKKLLSSPTLKRDAEFVNNMDNIAAFASAVNMLSQPLHKYLDSIKDLKGHTYNDEDWQNGHSVVTDRLDPYRAFYMPATWNPYYHIGMAMNVWRVHRHERNKADLARLQLMLLELTQVKAGESNPERLAAMEKQIDYYSNLINKLSAKIEDMEEGATHD